MVEKPAWPANQLVPYEFDQAQCRASLEEFAKLLDSQQELEEQKDILPFFRNHPHLAALFSTYNINIGAPNRLAFELDLFGKFRADLVIGDAETGNFVFVEFEEAKAGSIFRQRTQKGRLTPYWSDRFEQGFGQIVDWFRLTDDQRRTPEFEELFGVGAISSAGVLVIGRSVYLNQEGWNRLTWRRQNVTINKSVVPCITYDELLIDLRKRLQFRG